MKKTVTNQIKVGMVVVISIGILLGLFFKMGNFDFTKKGYNINVVFNFAGGIATNAPVRLLGVEVGQVEEISIQYGEETKVLIKLWLDDSTKLTEDAIAYVSALGLMGEKYIEIKPGSNKAPILMPDSTIAGEDPFQIEAFTEKGEKLLDDLAVALKGINGIVDENQDELKSIMENVEVTTANLKELSGDLKKNPWKILTKPRDWKEKL